jgi:sugar phosphate isomerase/epimerase
MNQTRRHFIKNAVAGSVGTTVLLAGSSPLLSAFKGENRFKLSLAEWSLHNALFGGEMDNLDFPLVTKNEYGIDAVEYVSQFFSGTGDKYLNELLKITSDNGITNVLIMIDGEGDLGELYEPKRIQAVERHFRWIDAAKHLGCHSIRVNARGEGTTEEVASAAVDGLGRLTEYGEELGIGVIVENHGGYSSDGKWLSDVISRVDNAYCGTLPDFGNFCIKWGEKDGSWKCIDEYDRYKGMEEIMPFAKGVSAKSHDFNDKGEETNTDFKKMMEIVRDAGYKGYVGIEYEGRMLSEKEGILATKKLLEKVIDDLA